MYNKFDGRERGQEGKRERREWREKERKREGRSYAGKSAFSGVEVGANL